MRWMLFLLLAPALAGCLGADDSGAPLDDGASDAGDESPGQGMATESPSDGDTGPSRSSSPGNGSSEGSQETTTEDPDNEADAATAAPDWGTPATKGLRPGISMTYEGAQCTTSFLFTEGYERYFIATAAHCVAGADNEEDGCGQNTAPIGATVRLALDNGGSTTGTLAYNSWNTMQDVGESDPDACDANDFALIEIGSDDVDKLHPAALHFGGPTSIADAATGTIYGWGASGLKFGVSPLHPKEGVSLGTVDGGWGHLVYLASPGIPGDSGGFITTEDGQALGIASVIYLAPYAAANRYTDLGRAIEYMETHTTLDVELITWDEWNPSIA